MYNLSLYSLDNVATSGQSATPKKGKAVGPSPDKKTSEIVKCVKHTLNLVEAELSLLQRLRAIVHEGLTTDIRSTVRFLREALQDANTFIRREIAQRGGPIRQNEEGEFIDPPMQRALRTLFPSKL